MNMEFIDVFGKVTDWDLERDLSVRGPPPSAAEIHNHLPNVSVPKLKNSNFYVVLTHKNTTLPLLTPGHDAWGAVLN